MAAGNDNPTAATGPASKFSFQVAIGNELVMAFQEVSGLTTEDQAPGYPKSHIPLPAQKTAGIPTQHNVTLKRGVFMNAYIANWYRQTMIDMTDKGKTDRRTVVIKLLDENGKTNLQ